MILADVAAEDGHGADADGEGEKGLVHGADDDGAVDLAEIGHQIEAEALLRAAERRAVYSQHQHQYQQRHHHILGHALQSALKVEAQNAKAQHHGDGHIDHVDAGIGDHVDKGVVLALHEGQRLDVAGQETHKIVHHPAGDDGVERHEADVAEQGEIAVDVPFLAGLFQLVVHSDRACLGRAAHGKFHCHGRKSEYQ